MPSVRIRAGLAGTGLALAALFSLAVPGTASAAHGGAKISIRDNCDPATFNAIVGPGTCVGDGDTTFPALIDSLIATGAHPKWVFKPSTLTLKAGEALTAVNVGGERHTFSEVKNFGGGCVDALNQVLGLTPVPECGDDTFPKTLLIPGMTAHPAGLSPGWHTFQCLIHPWMHLTVYVPPKS
jgi:plastocyanin